MENSHLGYISIDWGCQYFKGVKKQLKLVQRRMYKIDWDLQMWNGLPKGPKICGGLNVVVQLLNCVQFFATVACQASLSFSLSWSVLKIHIHWIGDAIQPSHPLSLPSPSAFNVSQRQGLFQRVSSSHQVAKVFELQLQLQCFQWIFWVDFL